MQRDYENSSEAEPTKIVGVVELTFHGFEAKRKNAMLSGQNTDTESKLVEVHAVKRTMRELFVETEPSIKTLVNQLSEAQLVLEKLKGEWSKTEVVLRPQVVAVEDILYAERAPAKRFEEEVASEP